MSSALKVKECRDEKRDAWKHFSENKYLRVSVGARKETEEIYYVGQKGQMCRKAPLKLWNIPQNCNIGYWPSQTVIFSFPAIIMSLPRFRADKYVFFSFPRIYVFTSFPA